MLSLRIVKRAAHARALRVGGASSGGVPEYNGRLVVPLIRYLRDHESPELRRRVLEASELDEDVLLLASSSPWISFLQMETLTRLLGEALGQDKFRRAAVYQLASALGPLRFAYFHQMPHRVFELASRNERLMTRVTKLDVLSAETNQVRIRYASRRPETPWIRDLRMAQLAHLPQLWRHGIAQVEVHALGSPFAVADFRLPKNRSWQLPLLGWSLGLLASLGLSQMLSPAPVLFALLLLSGGAIGLGWESRRRFLRNAELSHELAEQLSRTAALELAERRELEQLRERSAQWSFLMEEQIQDRTVRLEEVLTQVRSLQANSESTLRGVSHDLRSPLTVVKTTTELLGMHLGQDEPARERVAETQRAVQWMTDTLNRTLEAMSHNRFPLEISPSVILVDVLVNKLRRRVIAMTYGRPVRASVFRSREAPDRFECDPIVLDRVLDQLLQRAVSDRESGSVVVEVTGRPGFLTVKISDTGRGLQHEELDELLRGPPPDEPRTEPVEYRASLLVELLNQVGGKLEVMQRGRRGTTIWVDFPLDVRPPQDRSEPSYDRVVTLRDPDDP